MVEKHQGSHGLHHRHGTGKHTRIVSAAPGQSRVLEFAVHRVLLVHHGSHRLKGHPEVNGLPIRYSSLHAAGTVRGSAHFAVSGSERVVVFAPSKPNAVE